MKTKNTKKKTELIDFDPVKMMRDIRYQLSTEVIEMTHEQEIKYLKKLIAKK